MWECPKCGYLGEPIWGDISDAAMVDGEPAVIVEAECTTCGGYVDIPIDEADRYGFVDNPKERDV